MAFLAPAPLPGTNPSGSSTRRRSHLAFHHARHVRCCSSPTTPTPSTAVGADLYTVLGLDPSPDHSPTDIRNAYLRIARTSHPDATPSPTTEDFDVVSRAYTVLTDPVLRRVYDATGFAGLEAMDAIKRRAQSSPRLTMDDLPEDDSSQTPFYLEAASATPAPPPLDPSVPAPDDACPRSVAEAIHNLTEHTESGHRYYAAWWISRFRVAEAEAALVKALQTDEHRTAGGGFPIRRRAAIAIGTAARPPTAGGSPATMEALGRALGSDDYFLRYRAAEAIARVSQRNRGNEEVPLAVVDKVKEMVVEGAKKLDDESDYKVGLRGQASQFDLDQYPEEVRDRLKAIFEGRARNEARSRRTTMTPNLDVELSENDEPYEWLLKAIGFLGLVDARAEVEKFTRASVPLVKYAAHKAMYQLTGNEWYVQRIVEALAMGAEHHYSQRVLIRDLGDLGHVPSASAMTGCGMVENSFKIIALKNLLGNARRASAPEEDLACVYECIDSLL